MPVDGTPHAIGPRDADDERLAAIKAAYDPHNMFRINHNTPPAA